jgi:hypothetical protein
MREQTDASAEERAQAVGLPQLQQVQDVEPDQEVLGPIQPAERESLQQRNVDVDRRDQGVAVGGQPQPRRGARELDDDGAALDGDDASDPELGIEAMGELIPWSPGSLVLQSVRNRMATDRECAQPP